MFLTLVVLQQLPRNEKSCEGCVLQTVIFANRRSDIATVRRSNATVYSAVPTKTAVHTVAARHMEKKFLRILYVDALTQIWFKSPRVCIFVSLKHVRTFYLE
jgi:hypothetical protein